ncbi:CBS domain-containing protein [Paraglaciecola sp. L1A13]|uniref:CBS domain-containing protein n=1 Tax=Paraglaciecola sp. L1A13 TaxID=2686359 RepID=UPI00131DE81D|nr:CBS domain-containing protein [Paraglaciecola sp. L1A13]
MRNIALYELNQLDELAWPETYQGITLDSPAMSVFTDFKKSKPIVIQADTPINEVEQRMIEEKVRLKIVLDSSQKFIGVISLDDLNDQEKIKRIASGIERTDLCVRHFMRTKEELKVILFRELKRSKIGDVVEMLRANGLQHCLVVDSEVHQIRGIVSASDLAKGLGIAMNLSVSPTFFDIFNEVYSEAPLFKAYG